VSTGLGQHRTLAGLVPWNVQYTLPGQATIGSPGWQVAADWYWGAYPPAPAEIPYDWLASPVTFRLDKPINVAEVTRTGGAAARATSAASVTEYGEYARAFTIESTVDDDPANLAAFTVAYHADPRVRCPQLTVDLLPRTDLERWRILDLSIGDRITVTGVPATWPEGADSLVIEGARHVCADGGRTVTWNTVPVVGEDPGVPGPWFRLDESLLDGTDLLPF
jgi:hypothetical protein